MASYETTTYGSLTMSSYKSSICKSEYSLVTKTFSLPLSTSILIQLLLQEDSFKLSWFTIQLCNAFIIKGVILLLQLCLCNVYIILKRMYKNFYLIPLGENFITLPGKCFLVNQQCICHDLYIK